MRTMLIPIPAPLKAKSRVYDLKERLDWGEPALTIIDVRDRDAFNNRLLSGFRFNRRNSCGLDSPIGLG